MPPQSDSGEYFFWSVCLFVRKNFNVDHTFWTVNARAFILHMYIHCDKIFLILTWDKIHQNNCQIGATFELSSSCSRDITECI